MSIDSPKFVHTGLVLLLFAYGVAVALTLPGKLPWHDEITTLRDSRQSFSHLIGTYYTHKGYILAAKASTTIFGESITALRLPSILMGGASLIAIFCLGSLLFRPAVGLAASLYLLLHPSFLFYSTDARGYQGAFLFTALTALFLWRGLSEARVADCVLAAVSAFLGLMMHPTGALAYPGMAVPALVLIVRVVRDDSDGSEARRKKIVWMLGIAVAAAAVLLGPRIWSYLQWETLLVPSRFVPEAVDAADSASGPLRSFAGWRLHFAPLIAAEHHTGGIVSFGWLLMVAGLILGGRSKALQGLLLALSTLAPFLFFVYYNPPFLVHRYLYGAAPFAILLVVHGCFAVADRLTDWLHRPDRLRRAVEGTLLAVLLYACWGPFRAEIAYSEYGATWMTPTAELAQQDFMDETRLVLVDNLPLWKDQLEMLGVPRERIELYRPSDDSESEPLLNRLDDSTWVVLRTRSQDLELQRLMHERGRPELRIEQGLFYLPPGDLDAQGDVEPRFMKAVRFLDESGTLDFRFHHSVGRILEAAGLPDLGKPFHERGIEGMARLNRWDYPRTFGAYTFTLAEDALENGEPEKAIRVFSRAFGSPYSRTPDYVAFLDKVPSETRNAAIRSWRFRPNRFSLGFIEALERGVELEEDFKAYWAFQGAQALDQNGRFAQALPLYDYSIRHGDSLGRSTRRLFAFHLRRGEPLEAARASLRIIGEPTAPLSLYTDLFKAIPDRDRLRVAALPEFDAAAYAEGLVLALEREEIDPLEKASIAGQVAGVLEELGFEKESDRVRESFPVETD